ncbi:MAG: hypothetical protein PHV82_05745 [Victivallaceae bacterium]|nr:hypothetical protein [Victivallaceae bacterium]
MRKIYLFLNIIFISAIVLLLGAYSRRIEAAAPSAASAKLPQKKVIKNKMPSRNKSRPVVSQDYAALLADSKLFEKDRGEDKSPAAPAKGTETNQRCDLKLMGICHFGELKGAIIVSNRKTKSSDGKSFFKIGEDVGDGFKLYEITQKTAILKNGSRQVELELAKAEPAATPRSAVPRSSARLPASRSPAPRTQAPRSQETQVGRANRRFRAQPR